MSQPSLSPLAKIEEALLYVAPVHASVVRDARAALVALVALADGQPEEEA
jgi:hypothetical protein